MEPGAPALTGEAASWLESVASTFATPQVELIRHALNVALPLYGSERLATGEPVAQHVLGAASILSSLRMDHEAVAAEILKAAPNYLEPEKLRQAFGPSIAGLLEGAARMNQIQALGGATAGSEKPEDKALQAEALRKMLLAMAEDIRVVLINLADRTQTLRYLVNSDAPERHEVARETLDLFAPLANRLGVWQAKWELEDLSFRILEPELYKKIADQLDEQRAGQEKYIVTVVSELQRDLQQAGVKAEITGRPKHIYSIYKKMQKKHVDFDQIYDARAVRILVKDIKDCYAALGVVHNLWQPIPKEFDDYIAKPKTNDYRSLHTAVIGPEGNALEVQIRTLAMHRHSELGVAAHWRYKEGGRHDPKYDDKIAWLRQLLEWKDEVADAAELAQQFKTALFQDTVYVLTPQGKVIDLPKGSTPVDFAYAVHTDLGHRCRGAKVDGHIVPLNYQLKNAQRLEITAAKQGAPSRDWLNPNLGYIKSHRARTKVRQWFNTQEQSATLAQGRKVLERELHRHGMSDVNLDKLAEKFKFKKLDDFLVALAHGEISSHQLDAALRDETRAIAADEQELPLARKAAAAPAGSGILVLGVDKLLTVLAKCCKPAPPDRIIGFVTRGRGVTIHRQNCVNLVRLSEEGKERLIEVDWGGKPGMVFAVDIEVEAADRTGLLRDISDVLSREKINVTAANTLTRDVNARMFFTLEIFDLRQLERVLALIREVPGVVHSGRK